MNIFRLYMCGADRKISDLNISNVIVNTASKKDLMKEVIEFLRDSCDNETLREYTEKIQIFGLIEALENEIIDNLYLEIIELIDEV